MNPIFYFILFFIFLLCQYAIFVTSNVVAQWFGVTGKVYWCVVVVIFLLLNEFCFGAYETDFGFDDDDLDEDDWVGEEE